MNLNSISINPHALGYIKVACEDDPLFGEGRTRDEFLITARHHAQADEGQVPKMAPHPLQEQLAKDRGTGTPRVTEVPVRLFFNTPERALSIRYQAFNNDGVPVCAGNGKDARRVARAADNTTTLQDVACPGPALCELVQAGSAVCRRQVRMAVQIEGQDDPLSVFEVRTSSLNTYRALGAQLQLIAKRFGGLRHVPLRLTLWQASNQASSFNPFSLMKLTLDAASEADALAAARKGRADAEQAGLCDDMDALFSDEPLDEHLAGTPLEYQAVSEFYSAPVTRRTGTEAVARARSERGVQLAGAASSFIETAMRTASSAALPMGAGEGATGAVPESVGSGPDFP